VALISAAFAEIKKVRQRFDEPSCLPKAVFMLQAGNKGPPAYPESVTQLLLLKKIFVV
jgi:hypothetical protein